MVKEWGLSEGAYVVIRGVCRRNKKFSQVNSDMYAVSVQRENSH